jgi:hypothetical protein
VAWRGEEGPHLILARQFRSNPTLPSRRAPRRISSEDLETEERADTEATPPKDDGGGRKKGEEIDPGALTSEADSERGRDGAENDGSMIGEGAELDMFGMDVVGDLGKVGGAKVAQYDMLSILPSVLV